MEPELSEVCGHCGHVKGEHFITAERVALRCLQEDCHCTRFHGKTTERDDTGKRKGKAQSA